MKRRDFLFTGAMSVGSGLLATRMYAGSNPVTTPVRTARLMSPSAGNVGCQDTIFDGKNLICLYQNQGQGLSAGDPNVPSTVAATTTAGNLLWSYPLPKGMYVSLGTHQGSVVLFTLNYFPTLEKSSRLAILLLDPSNGNITEAGRYTNGMAGLFRYAGDSTFFRISSGAGEVWSLNNGFVQTRTTIASPTLAKKFTKDALIASDTMAVVDSVGTSMALVSLTSGSVTESTISSDTIANSSTIAGSATARAMANSGTDTTNRRMATQVFVTAVGGDQTDSVYAVVPQPTQPPGVVSVVRFNTTGFGTTLGSVQLNREGRPYFASKIVIANSEMAVLSMSGDVAWYKLPLA